MQEKLHDYLKYEQDYAERHDKYNWRFYLNGIGNYLSILNNELMIDFMLSHEQVRKYPWLMALFREKNLSSFVRKRRESSFITSYVDYMGPGNWRDFCDEIPEEIFAISLDDANNFDAPEEFLEKTTRIFSSVYDVRTTIRQLKKKNFKAANITTETAKGPLWRFMERDLIDNFPLELVWEYYFFMFRTAYSLSSTDGSVMLIQIPSINSRSKAKLLDSQIDSNFSQYMNNIGVPTFISGDMLISVKTEKSPKTLERTRF